jgi:hypothetical protein
MENQNLESLKYPMGKFVKPEVIDNQQINDWIAEIEQLPAQIKALTENISEKALDTPYRPEGWTVRQVIHHVADSHSNAFTRFKLALTEDNPTIKPYLEAKWAELADSKLPINPSLQILEGLHHRWVTLLKTLGSQELSRTYFHPESKKTFTLAEVIGLYAWHSRHHLAHIKMGIENSK